MSRLHIGECHCAACVEFDAAEERYDEWLRVLDEDVIQGEFGYEQGEFTVYSSHWRELYDKGLTPRDAWQRALDGFANERKRRDDEKAANYARIVEADEAAVTRERLLTAGK